MYKLVSKDDGDHMKRGYGNPNCRNLRHVEFGEKRRFSMSDISKMEKISSVDFFLRKATLLIYGTCDFQLQRPMQNKYVPIKGYSLSIFCCEHTYIGAGTNSETLRVWPLLRMWLGQYHGFRYGRSTIPIQSSWHALRKFWIFVIRIFAFRSVRRFGKRQERSRWSPGVLLGDARSRYWYFRFSGDSCTFSMWLQPSL